MQPAAGSIGGAATGLFFINSERGITIASCEDGGAARQVFQAKAFFFWHDAG